MGSANFCIKVKAKSKLKTNNKVNKNGVDTNEQDIDIDIDIDEEILIQDEKRGSLKAIKRDDGKLILVRRDKLIFTQRIRQIMTKFYLTDDNMLDFFSFFKKIDRLALGYITIDDLYFLIHEKPSISIVGPFLERFFILIEKEYPEKLTFEEFLPNLISFCLFSKFQLIEFVFNFLDKDHDKFIGKEDILKLFRVQRENNNVYFVNHERLIDNFIEMKRSDKINLEDFIEICNKTTVVYYPALYLQNLLKSKFIGNFFWKKLKQQIQKRHLENIKNIENIRIDKKIEEIRKRVLNEKIQFMKEKNKLIENGKFNEDNVIFEEGVRLTRKKSDTVFYLNKVKLAKNRKKRDKIKRVNSVENIILKNVIN